MDYDFSSPIRKIKCDRCKKDIDISRFDLHEMQCKVKDEKPKEPKPKVVVPPKPNPKKPESTRSQNNDSDERIPCINCDYQMKLTELDSHPKVCVNREINCHHCSIKYPRNLMNNHLEVCPSRPVRAQSIDYGPRQANRDEEEQGSSNARERGPFSRAPYVHPARIEELPRRYGYTAIEAIRQAESRSGIESYAQGVRHSRFLIQTIASRALGRPQSGLPSQSIRAIPEIKYEPAQQEECCSICCVQFSKGEKLKDLKCLHKFHTKCISEWLKINRVCPLCKSDLSVNVPNIQRKEKVEKTKETYEDSVNSFLRILKSEAGFFQDSDESDNSDAY